jgi:hypothetical protein
VTNAIGGFELLGNTEDETRLLLPAAKARTAKKFKAHFRGGFVGSLPATRRKRAAG